MRCRTATVMVYLYRPDELTEGQSAKLMNHLARCKRCAREAQAARRTDAAVTGLRERTPMMADPRSMTMAIMRGVESEARSLSTAQRLPVALFARLQLLRPALGLVMITVLGAFLTPLYIDGQKIAALERKLSREGVRSAGEPGLSLAGELSRGGFHGGENLLTRRAEMPGLPALLRLLEELGGPDRTGQRTFLEYIAVRYPRLASVDLEDGIDERERAILSTEGSDLLHDLQSVIDKEGNDNAR